MQKYFRTRENRNFSTVKSTEQRIFNFSLVEVLMMVGMAAVQVLVVRFFFQGARKGKNGPIFQHTAADLIRLCINLGLHMNRIDMAETKIMTCLCSCVFRYINAFRHVLV